MSSSEYTAARKARKEPCNARTMSGPASPCAADCEIIAAGKPFGPPAMTVDMFGLRYPVMDGAAICASSDSHHRCVVLAMGHPDIAAGLYMGLEPDHARAIGAWLLAAANVIDGGAPKQ